MRYASGQQGEKWAAVNKRKQQQQQQQKSRPEYKQQTFLWANTKFP